jgi:hypothetical protein
MNFNRPFLNFDTTENLIESLWILERYNGFQLSNHLIEEVAREFIQKGIYRPIKVSKEVKEKWKAQIELEYKEVDKIIIDNPQKHKEPGFEWGWESRFDTWFEMAKELGFVYYWKGEKIEFSESGKMLLDRDKPENEQMVFANAFAKYQRHNPFRRILNKNVPLILLINVIQLLNNDKEFNGAGISKKEIPLLLCWRDNDANSLFKEIKSLRKKYGYSPSDEIILDRCKELIENNGKVTKMKLKSILVEYPDDFTRKMRLTGLITVRGGGRFIDINKKEISAINYILKNYSIYNEFKDEKSYFKYIGTVDKNLISNLTVYKAPAITTKHELSKWANHYGWEKIKKELQILARNSSSSRDQILRIIERPLRLEFLTSLAILSKLPNVTVKPNFTSDDEGLPVSFAPGGNPDIECHENKETVLVEVTLLTGSQQHIRESYSIQRHLNDYVSRGIKAFSLFVSPKAYTDTCGHAGYIQFKYGLEVRILDIDLFLEQLETKNTLRDVAYTASSCN